MAHDDGRTKRTLTDADIVSDATVARRSALGTLGAALLGAVALAVGVEPAVAEAQSCSDSDPNDAGGRGRHCRGNGGCTDSDPNDGAGRGRNCGRRRHATNCTDSDPNDGSGNGRHCRRTGCTDSDGGSVMDGAGFGRHCGRPAAPTPPAARHCTDSDAGTTADGVNRGRNCT